MSGPAHADPSLLDLQEISEDPDRQPSRPEGMSHKTTIRLSENSVRRVAFLRQHYGVGSVTDVVNIAIALAFDAVNRRD